jgi:hypothetical protein
MLCTWDRVHSGPETGFELQRAPLQILAEGEASQRPVGADDAVAGDHQANGIGGVRPPDGAGRAWPSEGSSDLPIRLPYDLVWPKRMRRNSAHTRF